MITCKLCGTDMSSQKIRKDGSLLCPECGQIYWRAAVERAAAMETNKRDVRKAYREESRKSVQQLRARVA